MIYVTKIASYFQVVVCVFHHHIIEGSDQKGLDMIFDSLPSTIQSKILRYKNREDRNRIVAGKALLIEGMKVLGIGHDLNEIKYSPHQRPYFNDLFDFNISHSHDRVVCAISKTNRVGIDVEKIKPVDFNDFKIGFSNEDWNDVLSAGNKPQNFYSLWTKRESFLKAIGTGFIQLPSSISYKANEIIWNEKVWSISQIFVHKEYSCHLTVDEKKPEIQLAEIKFN